MRTHYKVIFILIAIFLFSWSALPEQPLPDAGAVLERPQITATSILKSDADGTYGPENLMDGKADTAWCVGNNIGEAFFLTYPFKVVIKEFFINNGFGKNNSLYVTNNSVRGIKLTNENGEGATVMLEDSFERQKVLLRSPIAGKRFKFQIVSVYRGNKYRGTCLSEIDFGNQTPSYGERTQNLNRIAQNINTLIKNADFSGRVIEKNMVRVYDKDIGLYLSGTRTLFNIFDNALGDTFGEKEFQNIKPEESHFEHMTGIALCKTKIPFCHYNPAVVRWGADHLIPHPSETIDKIKFQKFYDAVAQRFMRKMAESRMLLEKRYDPRIEIRAYESAAKEESDLSILDWLESRYKGILASYDIEGEGLDWRPELAMGFWLRRSIDGSADEIYHSIKKIMLLYDAEWYRKTESLYNKPKPKT